MAQKPVTDDQFCFTWGLSNLKDMGYVPLYQFMLRYYSQLGVSRQEMLCIIHLASYHYNSPAGQSRPSLTSIAQQMGYAHKQRISEIIQGLEDKGLLLVKRRLGRTSVYNAAPFAQAAYRLWLEHEAAAQGVNGSVTPQSNTPTDSVTLGSNTPTGSVTPQRNRVLLPSVTEEEKEEQEKEMKKKISPSALKQKSLEDDSALWTRTLALLRTQMTRATYDQWLAGSEAVERSNGVLRVQVRHAHGVAWLARLADTVNRTASHEAGEPVRVEFIAQEEEQP